MRMIGAKAVTCIEIVHLLTVGDDIHSTTKSIAAKPGGHHTLINLDMINDINRQIGQHHTRAFRVKRHTVEEIANGIA